MNLQDLRTKIDKIDGELLALFDERMKIVSEVAQYKKENNLAIYTPGQ